MKNSNSGIIEVIHSGHRKPENGGNGHSGLAPSQADEYFHLIADNARDLIFHVKLMPSYHFDYVSPSSTYITGYTPEEFYADPFLAKKCIHPEDFQLIIDPSIFDSKQKSKPIDIRWTRKDGKVIWAEHMTTLIRDKQGKPESVLIIARDVTERKHMEEEVRVSEEKYRVLFDNLNDAAFLADIETGTIIETNRQGVALLGRSREEIIGMHQSQLHPPEKVEEYRQQFMRHANQGNVSKDDSEVIRKDGTIVLVSVSASTLTINGKACILGVFRDITERKKDEEALLESQKFTNSLLENAPHATVVINPDTSVKYVNPAWEKANGWTLAEVVGMKAPYPWWPAEFKDTFAEGFKEAMTSGSGNGEVIAQKKNGERYWIDMNWAPVTNNGELVYLLINSVDITERMKSQEALRESESRYRSIFESANDIILLMDHEGKIIDINGKVKEIAGYEREDFIGRYLKDLGSILSESSLATVVANFKKRLAGTSIPPYEIEMYKKNGEAINFEINAMPLKINEKVSGDLATLRDITLQKRSMLAIKESEEKFSKAFASSPNAICIINKESKFIEVNESFLRFTGYSREEIIGHTHSDLNLWVNEDDISKMPDIFLETGKIVNLVGKSRRKSGEIRTGLFAAQTIDIGGKECMIQVINDITEQIQAQQALRESEEKFSKAFHASPDMMIITDVENGTYIDVNESFCQCTGYTREELVGHNVNDFDMWVDPAEVEKFTQKLIKDGKVRNEEYRFRKKTGEIRTWLCSSDVVSIGGQTRMLAVAADITERKTSEMALRESEEKFSKAFHASPFSISISRLDDGKFIEVNDSFLKDKGYTRKEIIGHSAKEFNILSNHDEASKKMRQTLIQRGQVNNHQLTFRTKSGHIRTGLISAEIINIKNEPCMLVINNDITQQKLAEEQLRLLSSVTQQVMDATIITDLHFKITYMNQAAQKLFGYTIGEARGKSLDLFNDKPIAQASLREILDKILNGKVWSSLAVKKHKNGRKILCECHMSPLYDEKGQICSFIDVQRDVTKQEEMEAKLQEHKRLIDSILATMPEGVLVIDNEDRILLANKAFHDIFHLYKKTIKNNTLDEVLPEGQFFDLHKAVKSGDKENNTLEFRYQVQDLEKIIYCVIVKMDAERTLLTFSDVSGEREEEEKLYLTDRLASIGEMAAGLAHELNNPLTGILALSQILVSTDIQEEHKEDLECILSEAKRAAGIVKNVLLFARNKTDAAGRSPVNETIKDVLRLREYEQRTGNIKVVTNLEENLPDVPLDKGQLQQVFLNIISNAEAAIKEVDRPGVITVTTQRVNSHVHILFSDNGCGIKKQILPRIFDPFFTTKEIGKGTGLGLSICYSIVVKHGGKISVQSQVNEGTTFTIRLPVVLPES